MKRLCLFIVLALLMVNVTEAKSKQSNDGVDVSYVHSNIQDASDFRSQSIVADITGHTLTIEFKEDVVKAHVIVRNNYGAIVAQETVTSTPDVITFAINDAGHYRMEIILVNGDQYYGDFQVMN